MCFWSFWFGCETVEHIWHWGTLFKCQYSGLQWCVAAAQLVWDGSNTNSHRIRRRCQLCWLGRQYAVAFQMCRGKIGGYQNAARVWRWFDHTKFQGLSNCLLEKYFKFRIQSWIFISQNMLPFHLAALEGSMIHLRII